MYKHKGLLSTTRGHISAIRTTNSSRILLAVTKNRLFFFTDTCSLRLRSLAGSVAPNSMLVFSWGARATYTLLFSTTLVGCFFAILAHDYRLVARGRNQPIAWTKMRPLRGPPRTCGRPETATNAELRETHRQTTPSLPPSPPPSTHYWQCKARSSPREPGAVLHDCSTSRAWFPDPIIDPSTDPPPTRFVRTSRIECRWIYAVYALPTRRSRPIDDNFR